jgi:hypothetical protein
MFVGAIMVTIPSTATRAGARSAYWRGCWLVGKLDHFHYILLSSGGIWDTHVGEAVVILDVLIVEPRAVAGLPGCCAHHAELGSASALCCYHLRHGTWLITLTKSCGCTLPSTRLQPCSCSTVANLAPWPSPLSGSSPRPLDNRALCEIFRCTTRILLLNMFHNEHISCRMSSPCESGKA